MRRRLIDVKTVQAHLPRWDGQFAFGLTVFTAFALSAASCAAPPGEGAEGGTIEIDSSTNAKDTASPVDTGNATISDDVVSAPDVSVSKPDLSISDDSGAVCPGDPSCDCKEASDCDNGFCIETPAGLKCAEKCVDTCPAEFKCATVSGGGGDSSSICVPRWGRICDPCAANADCTTAGNLEAACIDRGDEGTFCGSSCDTKNDCPSGYACSDIKDVNGAVKRQCVAEAAACLCSPRAIAKELSTGCFLSGGDGKCAGKRSCLPKGAPGAPSGGGLTACTAPKAAPEACDGKDNDCDGATDEETCNDDNVCTNDSCGGDAGCKHAPADGSCDADGSKCTANDVCEAGKCKAGEQLNCEDANDCTNDACDGKTGCTHAATNGGLCNADDNNCTTGDICNEGVCNPGVLKKCESGDQCITGKCVLTTGKCKYTPLSALPCDDNNPCTADEICDSETCKPQKKTDCDDKNACTTDSCDVTIGCKHKPSATDCDDGNKCTESDSCDGNKCVGLAVDVTQTCGDGNPCTANSCDPAEGCVSKTLNAVACSDDNPCTEGDSCKVGKCIAGGNVCACNSTADCAKKEDGNACNGTLICDKSKAPFTCAIDASSVVKCDTSLSNACQTMACDPSGGKCQLDKKPKSSPCDADGSVCTPKDGCDGGKCVAGLPVKCDDDNVCTVDVCDKTKGCTFTPADSFCDADGDKCTQADKCDGGICVAGVKKQCKDGNDCTADLCDAKTGFCAYTQLTVPCDDGDKCTLGEKCGKHGDTGLAVCGFSSKASCDDGNECTTDSCDKLAGCIHKAASNGSKCDDGNKCTSPDACKSGICAGTPLNVTTLCDDNNACTKESCSAANGCDHTPLSGTSCSDGNVCTEGDGCSAGKCASGTNTCGCEADKDCLAKEDGNACNGTLFCDKAKPPFQCKINPLTVIQCDASKDGFCQTNLCNSATAKCAYKKKSDSTPCDADGSICSVGDTCLSGLCTAGNALKCDDNNACTADSCDPKKGCQHSNQTGKCDADGNECTGPDFCKDGTCQVGGKSDCDDSNSCTADSCDTKSGKCAHQTLAQSCDDGDACTKGDTCGKNTEGKHVCLTGTKIDCDDANVCTADSCDSKAGCKNALDQTVQHACYSGDKATRGKGACKDGKATCKADGTLDTCVGETVPAAKELCDGADDDCDGTTDEGCKATDFSARLGNAVFSGTGKNHKVRVFAGGSAVSGKTDAATGGKTGAKFGFYEWLKGLLGT